MSKTTPKERRVHPRINQNLPISVVANGYDFVTSTMNISCLGAYCRIEKYVPPFTRVRIKMELPMARNEKAPVECDGVIVRSEDEAQGGFNVAIYFNKITDAPRKKITQYINQFLP
ncbi:MAG: PilZ domain-containing protein [Candidatus Omnitrophota bacterium]|nr:PilZ domain-containing protein [Candidatus Omnitrophota bacterium]